MMTFGWRLNVSCYQQTAQNSQSGAVSAPAPQPPGTCPSILWFYLAAAGAAVAGMMTKKR